MDIKKVFLAALAALAFSAEMAAAGVFPLDGSKHDLSSAGTGSYKASGNLSLGGTTEICIFCHTPHGGNTEAPLWNRAASVATYQSYTSDVLGGLGYWAAEDPKTGVPHSKTRICLSCHDGTIALGSVVNMPNNISGTYTEIQMSGDSKIQQSAPGFIGIDLRDDHPVAIKHDRSRDLELVTGALVGGGVRLYRDNGAGVAVVENADGNYVECTSCHNPHDNRYGNFLVASNAASAVCKQCHTKTGFEPSSIHFTATDAYSPPDGKGGSISSNTQISGVECMNCHFPHKAGIIDASQLPAANPNLVANSKAGYYLLAFQEEMSCFNNTNRWGQGVAICHGSLATANRNIQTVENSSSSGKRHWTQDSGTVGRHEVTEGKSSGWINVGGSLAKWHIECADCHNPHSAGNINHTAGSNAVASNSPLYGAGGVSMPGTPRTWTGIQGSGYTYREPLGAINTANSSIQYEYEICFKCHTDFAWGTGSVPNSPSLGMVMTDQAMEFNTANVSFHPVVGVNGSNQGTMVNPWTTGNQTMYCSDCHTKENGSQPLGPHGSANAFILALAYNDAYTSNKNLLQSSALGSSDDLCFKCHSELVYQSGGAGQGGTGFSGGGTNLHTQHRIQSSASVVSAFGYRCVNCHTRVPHGYNRKAMIVRQGEGAPYEAGVTGAGKIATVNLAGSGLYPVGSANRNANCTTVAGCHQ